jgi:hypothetical protein
VGLQLEHAVMVVAITSEQATKARCTALTYYGTAALATA